MASYGSAEEAIAGVSTCCTDVMLMDINLPAMSGIDCVAQLKRVRPGLEIIMLTMFEENSWAKGN